MKICTESIFDSDARTLVCPVNCEGVMGKGLALEFKRRYPGLFKFYKDLCDSGELTPGFVNDIWEFHEEGSKVKNIVLFPTKNKWREPSKIEWITDALGNLYALIHSCSTCRRLDQRLTPIAIPLLDLGLGGLDAEDVLASLKEFVRYLTIFGITDIRIHL